MSEEKLSLEIVLTISPASMDLDLSALGKLLTSTLANEECIKQLKPSGIVATLLVFKEKTDEQPEQTVRSMKYSHFFGSAVQVGQDGTWKMLDAGDE